MNKSKVKKRFGDLPARYNFSLNPYSDLRYSKCPDCAAKTGQLKLPLVIHVDPKNLIALNYTNRFCHRCDMLIAHKHEIEHYLTEMFSKINPEIIGNKYLVIGTIDKQAWRENLRQSKPVTEMRKKMSDFKNYQEIRMTMGGWFRQDETPPIVEPLPSNEWIKT